MEDLFTRKELEELITAQDDTCLSILMPAVQAGPEVRQNPTRFKNLLTKAERLLSQVEGPVTVSDFLGPLRALVHDTLFWANQSRGLALFRSSRMIRIYRIPSEFREFVGIADHYQIKPMISFLRQDQRFYVLALSKKEVRLIECSLQQAKEVDVPDLPKGMEEAVGYDDLQNRLQFRTGVARTGDKTTATFHAHGTGQEKPKEDILKYFQLVNKALEQVFQEEKAPLILAGVDYLLPIYAEANTYPNLMDQGIVGNPEGLPPEDLKRQGWPVIENLLSEKDERAISDYQEKAVRLPSATDIREVASSAYHGRVDCLFLSEDDEVWGFFDAEKNEAVVLDDPKAGSYDLLNFTALHTLSNGGTVIPVPRKRVPGSSVVAALFRY